MLLAGGVLYFRNSSNTIILSYGVNVAGTNICTRLACLYLNAGITDGARLD